MKTYLPEVGTWTPDGLSTTGAAEGTASIKVCKFNIHRGKSLKSHAHHSHEGQFPRASTTGTRRKEAPTARIDSIGSRSGGRSTQDRSRCLKEIL